MKERGNPLLKFFDRWVGPLLLMALAFLRSERHVPKEVRRVALLKPAAIGDLVLVSALISDLRRWNSRLQIVLFVSKTNAELAKLLDGVDEIVVLPMANPRKAVNLIRRQSFDLMIDCDSWPRITALFCALSRASWKLGFFTPGQFRHFAFDQTVEHSNERHELENYRGLLRALNIPVGSPPQNFSHLNLERQGLPIVGIHMFPGGTASHLKEWPEARWKELMMKLHQQDPALQFILTGGPADVGRARKFLAQVDRSLADRCEIRAGVSLKQTLADLKNCRALISVNTGILHLAAALGIPCVALHGPTNPQRWGPVGSQHQSVLSAHPRAGSLNLGFEYKDCEGVMAGITVDQVMNSFSKVMSANKERQGELAT